MNQRLGAGRPLNARPLYSRGNATAIAMGYFTNAFMFEAAPRFQAIAAGFPTCSVRGYQHVSRHNWLLDLWTEPKRGRHVPFRTPAGPAAPADSAADADTRRFIDELQTLLHAIAEYEEPYGVDECRLALAVAAHAAIPTFFFVSDDEFFDLACLAYADRLDRLRCRLGHLVVVYESGAARVEPHFFPEDQEDEPPSGVLEAVHGAVRWPVAEPVALEGGSPLFGSTLALWPAWAGHPDELLGWDAFQNLDPDFRVVFERITG